MKRRVVVLALAFAHLFAPAEAAGQSPSPIELPNAQHYVFRTGAGVAYDISVSLPTGYDPSGSDLYPVAYVTDGDVAGIYGPLWGVYHHLEFRGMVQPLILVAISQQFSSRAERSSERVLDLTPTPNQQSEQRYREQYGRETPSGGAEAFLLMLKTELIPWVEERFAVAERRALIGHSLGGLLAAYALLTDPSTFSDYLIASPSLWWDGLVMFDIEDQYATTHTSLPARVFLSVGSEDDPERMVATAHRMSDVLTQRAYPGLSLQYELFPGENHSSVVPAAMSRGLRYLFGPS